MPAMIVRGLTSFSIFPVLKGCIMPSIAKNSLCGKTVLFAAIIFASIKTRVKMPKNKPVPTLAESDFKNTAANPVSIKNSQSV